MGVVVFAKVQWPEVTLLWVWWNYLLLNFEFFEGLLCKIRQKEMNVTTYCQEALKVTLITGLNPCIYWYTYMLDSKKFEQISGKVMQMALNKVGD